ncbi:MAG: acyltransferase [Chitinophagaceae bacterium]|nr:MAG: acyltransferase [Chitinophagaceae bacterium]
MNPPNDLLRTRQHFEVLDGLRGIAAISVVVFHFMEIAVPDYHDNFIAHAYLAVDFFFCLSGFVVAYAYDGRLPQLGVWNFIKLRLIRLHPLVVFMAVVGLIVFLLDPFSDIWRKYSSQLGLLFGSSALMVPYPIVTERYSNLFHLNPPTWSLFWEYIANVFYALVLIRVQKWMLWLLVILSAVWLYIESWRLGNLSIGWGGDTFRGGIPRVAFAFMAGVLVFRLKWVIRSNIGFWILALLLMLMFLIPFSAGPNRYIDPTIVLVLCPLLVALGAGTAAHGLVKKACQFLGEISYPLYMIHYPFVWVFFSYVERNKPGIGEMTVVMAVATILLTALSYVVLKWVDEPMRRYLKRKLVAQTR